MSTVPRILLVEDNQADVYLIEQGLRARGFEFELVHIASGDEALQHCCPGPGRPLDPPLGPTNKFSRIGAQRLGHATQTKVRNVTFTPFQLSEKT